MAINTKHSSINSIERYMETFITRIVNAKLKALNKDNQMEGVVETRSNVNQNLSDAQVQAANKDPEERTEEENALLSGNVTLEDSDTLNEAIGKIDWMLGERVTYNDLTPDDGSGQSSDEQPIVGNSSDVMAMMFGNTGNTGNSSDVMSELFDGNRSGNSGNSDNSGSSSGDDDPFAGMFG